MTNPRKKKGFRSITVDGVSYRWRLKTGANESAIVIYGESSSRAKLLIELPGWKDPWLNLSGFTVEKDELQLHSSASNQPPVIASAFVHQAILAGLANGFDPASRECTLSYRDGAFASP